MIKADTEEAATIARATLVAMLDVTPTKGRPGADLRTAIGDFNVHALEIIQYDRSGPPLAAIFELARKGGASLPNLAHVRAVAADPAPQTLGAMLMKNSLINFALATEARILADTTFTSRNAVEVMREQMNEAFGAMQDSAADDMDTMTYRALITLHAAVTDHLVTTQRPLPVMLNFQFAAPGPLLVFAYRLYDDASRAEELREENKVVHPLFARPFGRALSA